MVLRRSAKYYTLDRNGKPDTVAIDRLKPAYSLSDSAPVQAAAAPPTPAAQPAFLPFVANSPGDAVTVTSEELIRDGFGDKPFFTCLLLELLEDGKPPQAIGYTLYFFTYSTWAGRVLFMEDIFVLPEHHRKGFGTFILKHLSKLALEYKCRRLSWQGIQARDSGRFYESIGAQCNSVWSNFKLDVQGMTDLAGL